MAEERIYLNSHFDEKDQVKAAGARWDAENKGWWVSKSTNLNKFRKWLPRMYKPGCEAPHVTSEMIPQNMWYLNLRSFLPQETWVTLRTECNRNAGHRCQVCGQKGPKWPVECNEQWQFIYEEGDQKGTQKLLRLASLCPACHSIKHLGKANVDGKLEDVLKHMAFINGWTEEQCHQHAQEAFKLWEKRSKMEWTMDLSILPSYGVDHLNVDIMKQHELLEIESISIQFRSYMYYFNRFAHLHPVRPEFIEAVEDGLEDISWQPFGDGVPFWTFDILGQRDQAYQVIDCTHDIPIHTADIDRLEQRIVQNERQNITTVILVLSSEAENDYMMQECLDANHPNYIRIEFGEDEYDCILRDTLDVFDMGEPTVHLFDYLLDEQVPFRQRTCGLEYLRDRCQKCGDTIYRFSGLVLPDREVSEWQGNDWRYIQHIAPGRLSEEMINSISPKLLNHLEINNIQTTSKISDNILECPHCHEGQTFGFLGDRSRIDVLHDENARLEQLIYKPITLKIDYKTMRNVHGNIEFSQFSA